MMEVSLRRIGAGNPRLEAELLFAHALRCTRISLLTGSERDITSDEERQLETLLDRRLFGEPLAYVLGTADFMGYILRVGPGVLIPRSETERLVEVVEEELGLAGAEPGGAPAPPLNDASGRLSSPPVRVLDVGTGSGAIPIALAMRNRNVQAMAIDISTEALAYARENVKTHDLCCRIRLLKSDLFRAIDESIPGEGFDAVISNPPYIPAPDMGQLPREIREHEPTLALDGGEQGTDYLMRLIAEAHRCLRPGGLLALEFSSEQAPAIQTAAKAQEIYHHIRIVKDLAGRDRFFLAQKG